MEYRTFEIVHCDNCGAEYVVFNDDPKESEKMHGVCTTCFMPMEVSNPYYFYQQEKNKCSERKRKNLQSR